MKLNFFGKTNYLRYFHHYNRLVRKLNVNISDFDELPSIASNAGETVIDKDIKIHRRLKLLTFNPQFEILINRVKKNIFSDVKK